MLVVSESFPNLSSCAGKETSHPSVNSCLSLCPLFPQELETHLLFRVRSWLLGLGFLFCFSFWNKLNSLWAILSKREREPFGLWWFNQANPVTSLSCDQWEPIPSPPARGGVPAKKHKPESAMLDGQGRSSFSVCCVREHGDSCWSKTRRWPLARKEPGKYFQSDFLRWGGKWMQETLGRGC